MVLLFPESKPYEKVQEEVHHCTPSLILSSDPSLSPEHHLTTFFPALFLAFLYVRINICLSFLFFFFYEIMTTPIGIDSSLHDFTVFWCLLNRFPRFRL